MTPLKTCDLCRHSHFPIIETITLGNGHSHEIKDRCNPECKTAPIIRVNSVKGISKYRRRCEHRNPKIGKCPFWELPEEKEPKLEPEHIPWWKFWRK